MADTGIGAGLPALDASAAAARPGGRTDKQDASGDKASFGNALERARDGNDRSAADARHADSRDDKSGDKSGDNFGERKSTHEDEDGARTRRNRPAIDIRMTGRIGPQAAAANGAGQPETAEAIAARAAAVTVAKLPRSLRPAGQGAALENDADLLPEGASGGRAREAGDEKDGRVHKGQKTARTAAGGEAASGKAAAGKLAAAHGSAENDALTLLQAADGADALPEDKAAPRDRPAQAEVKTDLPVAALAAHAMPTKAGNGAAKADGGVEHVGGRKGGSSPHVTEGGEAEVKTDAPASGERTFRFSRADGRGQTLDMVIGDGRKDEANEVHRSPVEAVTVLDSRRYLALAQNSNTVIHALSGDPEWVGAMQPGSALSNAATMASTGQVVNTLKIQIHPMTLGTVTATMRLAGDELTVDLAVETVAAYRQLSDDQRGLIDSLRAQGLSVDQVTITLVAPSDKSDASGAQANGQSPSFGQQAAQDGGASPRRDDRHAAQQNWRGGDAKGEDTQAGPAAGSGGARPDTLYI